VVSPLRVATFNLLHGLSLVDGQVSADGVREAANELDADILGLQEVDRQQDRSGRVDQTALVAAALGAAHWRFVPSLHGTPGVAGWAAATGEDGRFPHGPSYGIGLVSRWPVRTWRVLRFPPAPFALPLLAPGGRRLVRVQDEPRLAVAAVLDRPLDGPLDGHRAAAGQPLTVITAHLSFVPGWNVRQLHRIAHWARALPRPRLLLGDLNLPGRIPPVVSRWTQLARVPTYPVYRPKIQFDHVLGDGIDRTAVLHASAIPLRVSDHRALVVDLDL
jgi:endonuclease/exonuclease/phosphatase family metal-dependent hydrolase